MSNLSKLQFRKATVAVLTALLIVSIAMPLLSLATAATATVSISPVSGPNGTAVLVTGSGFAASHAYGAFTITVDGLAGKVTTTGLTADYVMATDSNGAITGNPAAGITTGYLVIGGSGALNLAPGPHTIVISDTAASPLAVTFTVTSPTVNLTPSTGVAGSSVTLSATGFPAKVTAGFTTIYNPTNAITGAKFYGTSIVAESATVTSNPAKLSSNVIGTTGTYSATVTLPAIGNSATPFELYDNMGNTGLGSFSTSTPTISLSPTSGPVGTVVTVTATGFGPGATFSASDVLIGTTAITTALTGATTATEQGTCVFQAVISSTTTSPDYVAGTHTITVKDSLKNVATASFVVTPKATITLGDASNHDSATTYAPSTAAATELYLTASGFASTTTLSITGSAGTPASWLTFASGALTTDANGEIATQVHSSAGTAAPPAGVYQVTLSDGVNSKVVSLTIAATPYIVSTPNTGAPGTTVSVYTYEDTAGTAIAAGSLKFDGVTMTAASNGFVAGTSIAWPTAPATPAIFNVPTSTSGLHVVSVTSFGSAAFTTVNTPAIATVTPSSAAPGTTITISGTGFAVTASPTLALTVDAISVSTTPAFAGSSFVTSFTVPNYVVGSHTIIVTDQAGNTATATFNIATPTITVTPSTGKVGASIAITGSGFKAGDTIAVSFDATGLSAASVGLTVINPSGGILLYTGKTGSLFTIPATNVAVGTHTITVQGMVGATPTPGNVAAATFTVTPSIALTSTAVRPGGVTGQVSGKGFAAASALTLTIDGAQQAWNKILDNTNSTTITTDAYGNVPTGYQVVVNSTTPVGTLTIAATDASSNSASTSLTVMAAPAITLNPTQIVAGSPAAITISGSGWTVANSRTPTAKLINSANQVVAGALTLSITGASINIGATGTLPTGTPETFTVASGIAAGTYTVQFILSGTPDENANATLTVMGAPTVTITPDTVNIGSNVSMTLTGFAPAISGSVYPITHVYIGATDIIAQFGTATGGSPNVPVATDATTGTTAYVLPTWFKVPTGMLGGTYTLTVSDGTRSATTQITIAGSAELTPNVGTTNIKGSQVNVAAKGFGASGIAYGLTINGVAVTSGTVGASGQISTNFIVPVTATANNTVVITDAAGNTATSYFAVTAPTLTIIPSEAAAGSPVQIFGSGFNGASSIFVQIGGAIVTTNPASIQASSGSFVAYVTVPAGISGNQTVTATDASNNVGTAYLTVTGGSGGSGVPNQTTMTSTAKTTTPSGTPATTFTAGSSAQASFSLQSTSGSRDVVVAVTWQQGAKVYGMSSMQTTMDATARTMSFQQLIPAGATGTWTATLQVFAADGTTPLGVSTLTFTVA